MNLIPPGTTIAQLEKKAADCEEKAKGEAEPGATKLREEALLYREWIAILRSADGILVTGVILAAPGVMSVMAIFQQLIRLLVHPALARPAHWPIISALFATSPSNFQDSS